MKYLVKDLSRLTGISAARIRKWQERYGLLHPEKGENGYWYYSEEDYLILKTLKERLAKGEKLRFLAGQDRTKLLSSSRDQLFHHEELEIVRLVEQGQLGALREYLDRQKQNHTFASYIRKVVKPLLEMLASASQHQWLSLGAEHTFCRYLVGYLLTSFEEALQKERPIWLVTIFPGEVHELRATLHYLLLLCGKVSARMVGSLSEKDLIQEIKQNNYHFASIVMVLPQSLENAERLRRLLLEKTTLKRIYLGGEGLVRSP
ncbi:MAG: MerR family transcriptional regulator [Leptospiraceae bacterium]|nr:MerR family transcriptional regulator [Leptospiraceae bacterium]MDW8305803.1 MerR family transcriptional regulator [Leptospiraceae bacterium]